ncbi:MAG: LLM class flavin-dependent oxidoreductase [Acidimicrobiia bacterium]
MSHGVVREVAREAERLGYTSFWVNDMPNADGLASLAAASAATSRIKLGVGVIPLDQRSPAVIGEGVRSSGLPLDRLLLGVGSGHSPGALGRVRSGVDELEREISAKVVIGALGPKMSALAGEVADGVLFNWVMPEYAERAGRSVLDAAERTDRPSPSLMAYVRCGLTPHAEQRLGEELERYAGVPQFARHVERMGVGARDTCVVGPDIATVQAGIARYEAVLDETIVRAITSSDSLHDLLELLGACAPRTAA